MGTKAVPNKTVCPRCYRTGFVRLENIIKAGQATQAFFCGACGHDWQIVEGTPPRPDSTNGLRDRSRV